MPNPIDPNYKMNVGRLVTDRYDFEDHINGDNFRHSANQIDLVPPVVLGSTASNNVQEAIESLTNFANTSPILPNATTTSPGIVQLIGEIGGTWDDVKVTKLMGTLIDSTPPALNEAIIYDGSKWKAGTAPGTFVAGNDLTGTNISQNVISLTGDFFGNVTVKTNNLLFSENLTPVIKQIDSNIDGENFTISAQTTTSGDGGSLILTGGNAFGGFKGRVKLNLGLTDTLVEAAQVNSNNSRILSLVNPDGLTDVQMPTNTGDLVIFIKDAETPPTTGAPVGGSILYSYDGNLNVKLQNGDDFAIGSIPNPSIWGPCGNQTYTERTFTTITTSGTEYLFVYPKVGSLAINTTYKVDVSIVAKVKSNDYPYSLTTNLTRSFTVINSGAATNLGPEIEYDPRFIGSGWVGFNLGLANLSGNTKIVVTTSDNNYPMNVTAVTQIITCCATGDYIPSEEY